MAWLLDTNILSELRRSRPEPKVLSFIETLPLEHIFVSVTTLAELRYGIEIITDAPCWRSSENGVF
jgi:toxin FitB